MTEQVETAQQHDDGPKTMKRRGILAAAGVAVAGLMAKQTAQSVGATHQPEDVGLNLQNFVAGGSTSIWSSPLIAYNNTNIFTVADDFDVSSSRPSAIGAYASGSWVKNGLFAFSNQPGGVAALGTATSANGIGVEGQSDAAGGIGVIGASSAGTGVKGAAITGFPMIGQAVALGNTAAGVLGVGTAGPGVQGQSTTGHGLVGTTDDGAGHAGLIGNANNMGGIGLMGIAPGYGTQTVGNAGVFYGNVAIHGIFDAPQMRATVKHQGDGTLRALHTLATPEGWIEDFGEASFTNSSAPITLDHDFAALIENASYQVYLTEYDDHHSLFVRDRSASGFVVQAKETVTASGVKAPTKGMSGRFGYRVVGKRRDVGGERLAKVAAPAAPKVPAAFDIPKSPEVKPPTKQP